MGSRKRSAKERQRNAFESQLETSIAGLTDAFAREDTHRIEAAEEREEARRMRACESKNRYGSRTEAEEAIRTCADHGTRGLHCYRCGYCNGWHLTSRPTP